MKNYELENSANKSIDISLEPKKTLVSMTDTSGNIEYCNSEFSEITGYDVVSLIGSKHKLLRHSEIPNTLYKYIWTRLRKEEEFSAILKNKNKNNNDYWVMVNFVIRRDKYGIVKGYRANKNIILENEIKAIIPIYNELLYLESKYNIGLSLNYFNQYFERKNITYDNYIENIINPIINIEADNISNKSIFNQVKSFFKND